MNPVHIVSPIEYAFVQWLDAHPESGHPLDMRRFYQFVKTMGRYKSSKWRDTEYVRARVLSVRPSFNQDLLDQLMNLIPHLIDFNNCLPFRGGLSYLNRDVSDDHYLEIRVHGSTILTKEIPLREYGKPKRKTATKIT